MLSQFKKGEAMRIVLVAVFALVLFVIGFSSMEIAIVCLVSFLLYGVLVPQI